MNKIMEVARLLGLEPFEEFMVDSHDTHYRFADNEFQYKLCGKWCTTYGCDTLVELIYGKAEIIPIPFEPKKDQSYYALDGHDFYVTKIWWSDSVWDWCNLRVGNVFRTEQKAQDNRARLYKELTGKELNPND